MKESKSDNETQETWETYFKVLEENGYINKNGMPIKCFCGNTELEEKNHIYEEHILIEYKVCCKECKKVLGIWAYGNWNII